MMTVNSDEVFASLKSKNWRAAFPFIVCRFRPREAHASVVEPPIRSMVRPGCQFSLCRFRTLSTGQA